MIPELTDAEYESLKSAIHEAGRILVPVVVTSDGEVIDGKGRVRAAEELKITEYPREVVHGLDAEDRQLRRVQLNCVRRHLSTAQKREVVQGVLRSRPELSNNFLGEMTGVDGKTVASVREELEATAEIPKLTAFKGKDGKTRPRYATARTPREQADVATALEKLGDTAPRHLLTAREVTRKARKLTVTAAPIGSPVGPDVLPDALVQIHHRDFRDMPVEPGSARLIFTDPLYHREHLPLYSALGEWAARVLQPGGLLVTYLGTSYLPEVIARLGERLEYVWMLSTVFAGQKTSIHARQIRTGWKPLLVYSNGPYRPVEWTGDLITAPQAKKWHRYEQPEVEAEFVLRHLTAEQDLVLDPFCGSGTTAVVCKRLNRRCVTTDIDPRAIAGAEMRIRETAVGEPLCRSTCVILPMPPLPGEDDLVDVGSVGASA